MKWCCVIKVYIRHPTQSFTSKKKNDFIYTLPHKGLLGVLNESWLSDWASDWGRASRGKRIRTVWLIILLVKNGHGATYGGSCTPPGTWHTHWYHMQLCSQSHPTTPLLQVGGFMLPFVVVGGCIVVLTLIMMVIVHSAGITICDVSSPYTSTAFSMGCSSCLSMLCPVESTRRTLSFRVLLRLLTNIMIVLLGKSYNCHVLIIPWTVHSYLLAVAYP